MLLLEFFAQNLHFAISLLAALVCFAIFWLYFDAYLERPAFKDFLKWVGFLLLSVSFVLHATLIEGGFLEQPIFNQFLDSASVLIRIIGYGILIYGQLVDPLQPVPKNEGLKLEKSRGFAAGLLTLTNVSLKVFLPIGAFLTGFLYWRRATTGLERHLKKVAFSFLLLGVFELLDLASLGRSSSNIVVFNITASFSFVWWVEHLVLLLSMIFFARWVWQYLTTRLQTQLFMIFTSSILVIFLVVTVSFTYLLLSNINNEALTNLEVAGRVFNYSLNSKKAETAADALAISQSGGLASLVKSQDHKPILNLIEKFFEAKKDTSIIVTGASGEVLARAEDPDRFGDSVSNDPLVKRVLLGKEASSVDVRDGVVAPSVLIRSSSVIRDDQNRIVGSVLVGLAADNAFVDSIQDATGLEASVYGGNLRAATTFVAPDGHSRWVGVKESNATVNEAVLAKGGTFKGNIDILNSSYLGVFLPLKDVNNSVVGMIFIGRTQASILRVAGNLIELTFIVAVVLLLLAIIPAFFVARFITKQLS